MLFKDFIRQTVYFDIHLGSSDTVLCTGYLEVHIAEVVLITEDIGQYGVFSSPAFLINPIAIPDTGFLIFTPASISASVPAHTVAMEDEPFDSRISDTTRTTYG